MTTEIPVCHICGSSETGFFCEKNGHRLYDCKNCDFTFVHPIPKNLAQIYGENYFKKNNQDDSTGEPGYTDYDKDKEPMREIFELYLKKLEQLAPGKRIFDVGAATGYFLDIAKQGGWKTHGSEISAYAANIARSRGHEMTEGSIVGGRYPEVDAATLWDVLEHVDDPRAYLISLNRMLPRGGMLAINTVDRSSLWARFMGSRWHLIVPPEHLYYYAPNNLERLLSGTGFEVIEVEKVGKKFSPAYVFKTLAAWQGFLFWESLARHTDGPFWRKLALPINLRDNVFVLARKRESV